MGIAIATYQVTPMYELPKNILHERVFRQI